MHDKEQCDLNGGLGAGNHPVAPALSASRNVARYPVAAIAAASFLFFGYAFIASMRERDLWFTISFATLSLSSIPWASTSAPWRDCLSFSLLMPICVFGASLAVFGYFAMFEFDWFERVFNGKGSGSLGLIVSLVLGFVLSGMAGGKLLILTRLPVQSVPTTGPGSAG